MRVVFAGTPDAAVPALRAVLASSHEVLAVLTRPDAPAGRGRRLVASPVGELAAEHGIEVLKPRRPSEPDFVHRLTALAPDCCPVVAYGALLPQQVLDVPTHGWVNLHFSLLPAWRGAAPVQRAVMAGDQVTGATTFRLDAGMDTGPVYGLMTETVRPTDTSGDLLARLAEAGAGLLVATLDGIADGSLDAVPQSAAGVSLAPKVEVAHAQVDWSAPAVRIDRLVRGCTPAPGAWTTVDGERLKLGAVLPVERADGAAPLAPGGLEVGRREVLVGTGTGPVRLSTVQPQGKRPMPAADWARGARKQSGDEVGR
ncbi:methionyl-tRNA formyltransferase [Angustibacter sp. McL0619]|uniref:methionyl-tRNA formyltransferase n=1 Tax=Angustibacter sp. McL0619 TaxID=3415676 RepID=UPI003CEF0659